ncbi:probable G-protein coupled receptor Mth-like 10 [Polistes fuscatus]|uniref:probable G-protein coupled receptor Mth-like 10 n=1 Tax=Polistes fuscatus TaxID=30207 RepID=UPI001CA9CFAF|nr:probable G-protein coupled receptor Mth-like 10 [Polistes fuscatus]XP_043489981.1 probable G-protein coupled receptor Mth-like 10 [Polistes fuscatus]
MCSIMRNVSSLLPFFILSLVLISRVIIVESTVPLIHSIPLKNGTNIPEEYKDLPIVAQCCPVNQFLFRDENKGIEICISLISSQQLFSPYFHKSNSSGIWSSGEKQDSFVALVGYPCHYDSFNLNEINKTYYLLFNGSIYYPSYKPSMLMPGKDYCMEYVPELGLLTRVCFPEDSDVRVMKVRPEKLFGIIGLLTSIILLILTVIIYLIIPKLRDIYGHVICHYCGCLAMAFIILAILELDGARWSRYTCMIISYVIQFFFIATYCWLNVLCIVTNNFIQNCVNHASFLPKTNKAFFFYYSLCAWLSSSILIIADICLNLNPMNFTTESDSCWIDSDIKSTSFYFFPVLIFLISNLIVFIFTGITIRRFKNDLKIRLLTTNQVCDRRDKRMLCIFNISLMVPVVLFFFMALTWTLQFITWSNSINSFNWYPLDLVNAAHGFFAFVIFVLRRPIRGLIWARIQNLSNSQRQTPTQTTIHNHFILHPLKIGN